MLFDINSDNDMLCVSNLDGSASDCRFDPDRLNPNLMVLIVLLLPEVPMIVCLEVDRSRAFSSSSPGEVVRPNDAVGVFAIRGDIPSVSTGVAGSVEYCVDPSINRFNE